MVRGAKQERKGRSGGAYDRRYGHVFAASAAAGQTMLEAIIAIGIMITAVASSLTLVQSAISAETESENGIVAANLAREAVEVVRGMRDANWLSDAVWDDGLEGAAADFTGMPVFDPSANAWSINFAPDDVTEVMAEVFRYPAASGDATEGLFVQGAPQPGNTISTGFRRLVTLDAICSDGSVVTSGGSCGVNDKVGIRVRGEVAWTRSGGAPRSIVVEEEIYDWR